MKFVLLCVVLCLGTRYGAAESDYVYNQDADVWLRLHTEPATWSDAAMRCSLEGGILASPVDSAMSQAMMAMMAEQQLTRNVFTGINAILARENFTSLEGVPLDDMQPKWADNEPNNANSDEDCLAMTSAGALADVSCDSMLPYFCRKYTKCGTEGYEYEPRTGSCYKFHRFTRYWRPAIYACHAEGGYLAVINDATESTVLKELYAKNPNGIIVGADEAGHAYIGFMKWDDGAWATLNGATIEEAGFTTWNHGEPSHGRGELCGSIHRNGLLNDCNCDEQCPFICEKNVLIEDILTEIDPDPEDSIIEIDLNP